MRIGIIVAIATPIIQSMMSNTNQKACCMNDGGTWENGSCSTGKTYGEDCK